MGNSTSKNDAIITQKIVSKPPDGIEIIVKVEPSKENGISFATRAFNKHVDMFYYSELFPKFDPFIIRFCFDCFDSENAEQNNWIIKCIKDKIQEPAIKRQIDKKGLIININVWTENFNSVDFSQIRGPGYYIAVNTAESEIAAAALESADGFIVEEENEELKAELGLLDWEPKIATGNFRTTFILHELYKALVELIVEINKYHCSFSDEVVYLGLSRAPHENTVIFPVIINKASTEASRTFDNLSRYCDIPDKKALDRKIAAMKEIISNVKDLEFTKSGVIGVFIVYCKSFIAMAEKLITNPCDYEGAFNAQYKSRKNNMK